TQWSAAGSAPGFTPLAGLQQHLPRLALAAGMLVAALFTWQVGAISRAAMDEWRALRATEDLDAPLRRILDARERADNDKAAIDALLALREGVPHNRLLSEV